MRIPAFIKKATGSSPQERWLVTIPPLGAARMVGLDFVRLNATMKGSGGGATPTHNHSLESFDCKTYLDAYRRMLRQPEDELVVDLMNQSLLVKILELQITHLLVLSLAPVTAFHLRILEQQQLCLVHWFFEDFRVAHYWKEVIGDYHHFLAIHDGPFPLACEKSGTSYSFLPTATSSVQPTVLREPTVDIAFIGIPTPYRVHTLERLQAKGFTLAIGGEQWSRYRGPLQSQVVQGEWVDRQQAQAIWAGARMGLNLSVIDPADDRENHQTSPRVFDILTQTELLSESLPSLDRSIPGARFSVFRNEEEMIREAQAILQAPMNRQRVRENGRLIAEKHLYSHRFETIRSLVAG